MIERFDADAPAGNACFEAFRRLHLGLYRTAAHAISAFFPDGSHPLAYDLASGCGHGGPILSRVANYAGFDASPEAVRDALARYPGFCYTVADLERADWYTNPLRPDVICSLETAEHLKAPAAFLANCRRLIEPGGLLVFSVPTSRTADFDPYHLTDEPPSFWRGLLREAGWQIDFEAEHSFDCRFADFLSCVPTTFRDKFGVALRAVKLGYAHRRLAEWVLRGRFQWTTTMWACQPI